MILKEKKMKPNKLLIASLFVIGLCGGSCSLDEPSYGKTTSDNYYQIDTDIEKALTGAYLQLRTTWYGAQYKMWHGQNVGRST